MCVLQGEHPLMETIYCVEDTRSFVPHGGISSGIIGLFLSNRSEEVSLVACGPSLWSFSLIPHSVLGGRWAPLALKAFG